MPFFINSPNKNQDCDVGIEKNINFEQGLVFNLANVNVNTVKLYILKFQLAPPFVLVDFYITDIQANKMKIVGLYEDNLITFIYISLFNTKTDVFIEKK